MKVKISDTTLIAVDCINYPLTVKSLRNCMEKCEFDKVVFCTDIDMKENGIDVVKIKRINSKDEYSEFMIKELFRHFHTKYCLVVQHDGTILNADCWDEEFKNYDYIGAKWLYPDNRNFGNGGFSFRSWKLQHILGTDENIEITTPEDEIIGRLYRRYLEKTYDIKFTTEEIADKFSFELNAPIQKTFGYHGNFHAPFKEHIFLKRTAACGDVIMLEPVISYYSENGYQVVLDTLPQFMELFYKYRHRVLHISEVDSRIKPVKLINFDMAYENNPQKPVLQSYIELTGEKIESRNSNLDFPVADNAFVFKKYILIHIDDTGMEHRNQHGINWGFVVPYYLRLGYQVFQIGKRMKDEIAPYMNTPNIESLMFMIKGADLVIGIDSSPTQIAVALGIPAVIFFGSVNPKLRYSNFDKIEVIHTDCPSGKETFCYHDEVGTTGSICKFDKEKPPCTIYSEYSVIKSINKLLR